MDIHEEEYEKTIDIKELIINTLLSWRIILIVALIVALFFGGYKGYSGLKALNNDTAMQTQTEIYESEFKVYQANKNNLTSQIEDLEAIVEAQNEYNENSILMKIDPFDKYELNMSYYVDTGYQIIPSMSYQNKDITQPILKTYDNLAKNGELHSYIIENLSYQIEDRYLREIITSEVDYDSDTISLTIVNEDSESCNEIGVLVDQFMELEQKNIGSSIGDYTLTSLTESIISKVDFNLLDIQKSKLEIISTDKDIIIAKTEVLNNLIQPINTSSSKDNLMAILLKNVALGFVIGLFLMVSIVIFRYIISGKLLDRQELEHRYNLKTIGSYNIKKKERKFENLDRAILSLRDDKSLQMSNKEEISLITAKLKLMLSNEKMKKCNVLFTGTGHSENIMDIYNQVKEEINTDSYNLIYGENINYNADTITQLEQSEAVILVEEINGTTVSEINKEIKSINDFEKKVIGVIFVI